MSQPSFLVGPDKLIRSIEAKFLKSFQKPIVLSDQDLARVTPLELWNHLEPLIAHWERRHEAELVAAVTSEERGAYLSLLQIRECFIEAGDSAPFLAGHGGDKLCLMRALPVRNQGFEMVPQLKRSYAGEVLIEQYNWFPKASWKLCLNRSYQFIGTDQKDGCDNFLCIKVGRSLSHFTAQACVLALHTFLEDHLSGFPGLLLG